MADNAGLFVKMWVKMLDDDWFIGLNCTERGLWCQLLLFAKRMGDSGSMSWRSWGHLAHNLGTTCSQSKRILTAFAKLDKVKITKNKGQKGYVFEVFIPNYQRYQELKGGQKLTTTDAKKDSFGVGSVTQDKNRIDKNRIDKSVNPDHSKFIKYWVDNYEQIIGSKYGFDSGKDGQLVKTLLSQFGYDRLCKMAILFLETSHDDFINKAGHTLGIFKATAQRIAEKLPDLKPQTESSKYAQELRKRVLGDK